jgi:hypothetical protein
MPTPTQRVEIHGNRRAVIFNGPGRDDYQVFESHAQQRNKIYYEHIKDGRRRKAAFIDTHSANIALLKAGLQGKPVFRMDRMTIEDLLHYHHDAVDAIVARAVSRLNSLKADLCKT